MVYVTGDTHGNFKRFWKTYFPEQNKMTKEDYVIITGDFGGMWDGSRRERQELDHLDHLPFTLLFVDGNHENFDLLNAFPEADWHGGRVHQVREHVLHLMRGQMYEIGGYTFFTMGGAQSHDVGDGILDPDAPNFAEEYEKKRRSRQAFRVKGWSWWPDEMPSEKEYEAALSTLEQANWKADYIISHCAPTRIAMELEHHYHPDKLTDFLELVNQQADFHYWLFGHYHDSRNVREKHVLLYEQIVKLF